MQVVVDVDRLDFDVDAAENFHFSRKDSQSRLKFVRERVNGRVRYCGLGFNVLFRLAIRAFLYLRKLVVDGQT